MESSIFDKLIHLDILDHLDKKDGSFVVSDSLSLALLSATYFYRAKKKMAVVTPNLYSAQQLYEQLISLVGEENLLFFPQDELQRIDIESYSKEIVNQRIYVLEKSLEDKPRILICHAASVSRYLCDVNLFKDNTFTFKVGDKVDVKEICDRLIKQSFIRVNKIDNQLQFALRGDILDIFPINLDTPIRIEIFDDEIEDIRYFNIADQRSTTKVDSVTIYPASDLLSTRESREKLRVLFDRELLEDKTILNQESYVRLKSKLDEDYNTIIEEGFSERFYKYYSLIKEKNINIFDYFKPEISFVYDMEKCQDTYNFILSQAFDYYSVIFKSGYSMRHYEFFDDLNSAINHTKNIIDISSTPTQENYYSMPVRCITKIAPNIYKSADIIKDYINDGKKVIVALDEKQYESYLDYLKDFELDYEEISPTSIPNKPLSITKMKLNEGFELLTEGNIYLSAREIFGYRQHVSKFLERYRKAKVLSSYEELEKGDYVVHEQYGIGVYEEISTIEQNGVHKDFLKIKYANSTLYVQLEKFKQVRKYVSKEGAVPKINRIGGHEWEKTKKKIKEKINDLADRLIALYAERNSTPGYAFKEDDEFQQAFERAFPYTLTSDQITAVNEIKSDMEKPHPMERLLCGDVGFGKTEVAFRAAFKAILSGTQVALLCPTTILARQHYERAIERFSMFGVKVAMFSRFVPDSIQKKQIEEIKEGKIHFVIGTHRLLSSDIVIPNLKLLIIDEEQRFGVEHKEKIKEIAKNIDCLTLTATPIPRTLQMSLVGMRGLSQLKTAPLNRMPIQTYVAPINKTLIKEAVERELARNGQVFFLHNATYSIQSKVTELQKLIPTARIDFVHGKMEKDDIEEVMEKFYAGEIDVLVCTSIIETGLDIPNANTIIIENADKFGLSQLYQIKGRVGRSNRVAYAYLLYDDRKELTDVAKKRLKALKDFTELGSGFKIAQRDLSIRGAGDILGAQQSGFIDDVGMDMYIKLLNEVIEEKQGKTNKEKDINVTNVSVDGYIPKTYANDSDKIELYQEIQSISLIPQLEIFKNKLKDIYGVLPQEVLLLIKKRKIDILSSHPNIEEVKETGEIARIIMTEEPSQIRGIGLTLFKKLDNIIDDIHLNVYDHKINIVLKKKEHYLDELEEILTVISEIRVQATEN